MGEYEYHANPIDWHKPSTAPTKGGKPTDLGVFRPPMVGRVGSLFNKIEVISPSFLYANHYQTIVHVDTVNLCTPAKWLF